MEYRFRVVLVVNRSCHCGNNSEIGITENIKYITIHHDMPHGATYSCNTIIIIEHDILNMRYCKYHVPHNSRLANKTCLAQLVLILKMSTHKNDSPMNIV